MTRARGGYVASPFTYHQHKIARDTMRMHCAGALIMGGMDHVEAARVLACAVPQDCTCRREHVPSPDGAR